MTCGRPIPAPDPAGRRPAGPGAAEIGTLLIDSDGLTPAQLAGRACGVCSKRWPRPTRQLGLTLADERIFACADCATDLQATFPDPQPASSEGDPQ
jgi:hypothetical protein